MRRLWLTVVVMGAVGASAGVALAGNSAGYKLRVAAPHSVRHNQAFTLTPSGTAKQRSRVVLFLAQAPCSNSYVNEYNAIGAWQLGDSYFRRGRGKGSKSVTSKAYEVHGSFKFSVKAYGGSKSGTDYVCAYIPSSDPSVTRAHASATYRVK